MLTPNERIAKLEQEIVELRSSMQIAGALPVAIIQATLDQLVDERVLPAAIRAEIFGRIRKELPAFRIGSRELAQGAEQAMPRYPTAADRDEAKQWRARWSREELESDREILRLRTPTPDSDQ